MRKLDPIEIAQALIRCPSITPKDAGALDTLQDILEEMGFVCTRHPFEDVDNLYARWGTSAPNFCFAGHTDVVPVGDEQTWTHPPFSAQIQDEKLWGRGAADMKGGIAAFVSAVSELLSEGWTPKGSISFLITGDEEGPALHGTKRVLEALAKSGEVIDQCLVGEPTNPNTLGEMIKIGRRGSLNGRIIVTGEQGHVAYPHLANNPVPVLIHLMAALLDKELDMGNDTFQPSNLEITTLDVGNPAHNIIPKSASAKFNIRFNTEHAGESLVNWINDEVRKTENAMEHNGFVGTVEADLRLPGHPFVTTPGQFTDLLCRSIKEITGQDAELSTTGGTSDARFITHYAPVVEFGLIGKTIHQIDEFTYLKDILGLTQIYKKILQGYYAL
jgi:succinyl-diaminopimelate desuccinylase